MEGEQEVTVNSGKWGEEEQRNGMQTGGRYGMRKKEIEITWWEGKTDETEEKGDN